MEAGYLRRAVGPCLAEGLAEVAATRPADPIEYLALWLLNYKSNSRRRAQEGAIPVVELRKEGDRYQGERAVPVEEPPVETSPAAAEASGEGQETQARPAAKTEPPPPAMPRIEEEEENASG